MERKGGVLDEQLFVWIVAVVALVVSLVILFYFSRGGSDALNHLRSLLGIR